LASLLLGATSAQAAPVTLQLTFSQRGTATGVITNGRYVLLQQSRGQSPTLLDERTGRRVLLPACADNPGSSGFEGPWFEWEDCSGAERALDLYALRSGSTRTIDLGSSAGCNAKFNPCAYPGPAGTDWMVLEAPNACGCGQEAWLRNMKTGAEVALPDRATVNGIADLSSPTQTFKVCSPLPRLRVKINKHTDSATANWFFGGDYGFVGSGIQPDGTGGYTWAASGAGLGGFAIGYDEPGHAYLERCGTRLARRLSAIPGLHATPLAWNSSALILAVNGTALRGILLPRLERFTIPLPAQLQVAATQFVLSRRTLWAVTPGGQVWSAPTPARAR
jgi:hypothetical protein